MLISDSHRFLFVHVQKTGGSTIDNSLTATALVTEAGTAALVS